MMKPETRISGMKALDYFLSTTPTLELFDYSINPQIFADREDCISKYDPTFKCNNNGGANLGPYAQVLPETIQEWISSQSHDYMTPFFLPIIPALFEATEGLS